MQSARGGRAPRCVPYGRGRSMRGEGEVNPSTDLPLQKQGLGRRVGAGHRITYHAVGAKHPVWDALVHGLRRFRMLRPYKIQELGRRVGAGHRIAYRMVGAGLCAERARSTHQQTCPYKNRDCVGTGRRGRRVGAEVGARQNPWDCVLESSASPLQKRGLRSARRGRARPCPVVIASPRRGRGNPCFENHQIASLVTA